MNQVQKLETLLERVQERRNEPRVAQVGHVDRVAQAMPLMASAQAAPAAAPVRSYPTERAAVVEERVSFHGTQPSARQPAPQAVLPEPRMPQPAATSDVSPRRPAGGRLSTPLEMALEDEFSKPHVAAAMAQAAAPKPTEPSMAAAPKAPKAEPSSEEPFTIEPEPMREGGRPIAQVMSKHSTEMDATFGAMLKRSLSLRPR